MTMSSRGGAGEVISHLILFFIRGEIQTFQSESECVVHQSDLVGAVPLIPLKYHVKSL